MYLFFIYILPVYIIFRLNVIDDLLEKRRGQRCATVHHVKRKFWHRNARANGF